MRRKSHNLFTIGSQFIYNLFTISKMELFNKNLTKFTFIHQHSQTLYDVMQKEIENLEFVQGVNFKFIDSLENKFTNYLIIFDDSCEEICNSKAFVNVATVGLCTIYIKHNLFHQNKHGRDVEIQNTHIVLSKSPRDVMQVSTLSAQLRIRSELVNWYRDQTSVP